MGKLVKEVSFINLDVQGDINVTGKVDGVDLSEHAADTIIHHNHINKDKLDKIDQSLDTASSPIFSGITVNGDIAVSGNVAGVNIPGHVEDSIIHHIHSNKTNLDSIDQSLAVAAAPTFAGLKVNGDITVTGRVDGVDVSTHAADMLIHHEHANKANLDAIDQKLGTFDSPAFAGLSINGDLTVAGQVDGVKVSAHAARHQSNGPDALVGALDANARVQIKAEGLLVGMRRAINFIAGENIILSLEDNPVNEEVNIIIKTTGGEARLPEQELIAGVAGEALEAFDFCFLKSDGKYYKANSLDVGTMPGLVLATVAFAPGEAGNFIRRGRVKNNTWNWLTIGGLIYASGTAGKLTQSLPAISGEQLQIVGVARSSNEIDFEPNLLLVEVA